MTETHDWSHWKEVRRQKGRENYRKQRERLGLPPPGAQKKQAPKQKQDPQAGLDVPMIHPACIPFGMYQQYKDNRWEIIHPHGSKRGITAEEGLQRRLKQELSRSITRETYGTDDILP